MDCQAADWCSCLNCLRALSQVNVTSWIVMRFSVMKPPVLPCINKLLATLRCLGHMVYPTFVSAQHNSSTELSNHTTAVGAECWLHVPILHWTN